MIDQNTFERGSILLYAILVMAVMMTIGLTINTLFVTELKVAASAQDSVVAAYAADSAAEKCLYEIHRQVNLGVSLTFDPTGVSDFADSTDATYAIVNSLGTDITSTCIGFSDPTSYDFSATGIYRNIHRTLEISQ